MDADANNSVKNGTHNFLGGQVHKDMWKKPDYRQKHKEHNDELVRNKQHHFQDEAFIKENKQRLKNHWASMTPEERKLRSKRISDGRKRKHLTRKEVQEDKE